jgi:hypothetical protein
MKAASTPPSNHWMLAGAASRDISAACRVTVVLCGVVARW